MILGFKKSRGDNMKITVITSSAHKTGTSALLANQFIKGATESGHEIFRFDAAFKNIHPCIGCNTCLTKNNGCVFKDDMEDLNPHILEADLIVFVSPIYYYDINAQLKAVIDRFYANNEKLQGNKKTLLLVTMADDISKSGEGALLSFTNMAEYMRWEVIGSIVGINCGDLEAIKKTEFPEKAYELGKNL